jgi:hypothetical protein
MIYLTHKLILQPYHPEQLAPLLSNECLNSVSYSNQCYPSPPDDELLFFLSTINTQINLTQNLIFQPLHASRTPSTTTKQLSELYT